MFSTIHWYYIIHAWPNRTVVFAAFSFRFVFFLIMHTSVCVWVCACECRREKGIRSPGARVKVTNCPAWHRGWELNLGPLQEQQALLAADPSLQALKQDVFCSEMKQRSLRDNIQEPQPSFRSWAPEGKGNSCALWGQHGPPWGFVDSIAHKSHLRAHFLAWISMCIIPQKPTASKIEIENQCDWKHRNIQEPWRWRIT